MIYTVFFKDENKPPQDFASYEDAKACAEGEASEYAIESTDGEIV